MSGTEKTLTCDSMNCILPGYNWNGWLGITNQFPTYLPLLEQLPYIPNVHFMYLIAKTFYDCYRYHWVNEYKHWNIGWRLCRVNQNRFRLMILWSSFAKNIMYMIDLLVVEQWHAGCLADCRSWCLDVTFVVDWVFRTNYLSIALGQASLSPLLEDQGSIPIRDVRFSPLICDTN